MLYTGHFPSRRASPIRLQDSRPCIESKSGENRCSAGGAPTRTPLWGEWEQILTWLVANPERSSGDIFRELQRLSPGRYQPLLIRTHEPRDAQDPGLSSGNHGRAVAGRSDPWINTLVSRGRAIRSS